MVTKKLRRVAEDFCQTFFAPPDQETVLFQITHVILLAVEAGCCVVGSLDI
jgi:hypothetical protein